MAKLRAFGSCILLFLFSMYIILVINHAFERIPCSCGGIISKLTWGQHLVFNLFFLALALAGFIISTKKGGDMGKEK
ncbi:MAG: MauE/DoxX family redox-associated membrane protein [Daejeonella sp.]